MDSLPPSFQNSLYGRHFSPNHVAFLVEVKNLFDKIALKVLAHFD